MLRTGPGSPKLLNKYQPLLIENPRHSLFLLGSSLYHFPHILFLSVISLRVISPLGSCNSEASTPLGGRAAVPVTPPPLGRGVGSIFQVFKGLSDPTRRLRTTGSGFRQTHCRETGDNKGNVNASWVVDDVKESLMCQGYCGHVFFKVLLSQSCTVYTAAISPKRLWGTLIYSWDNQGTEFLKFLSRFYSFKFKHQYLIQLSKKLLSVCLQQKGYVTVCLQQ